MKRLVLSAITIGLLMTAGALIGEPVFAEDEGGKAYEVTVTNLTRGQTFTPILVASHKKGVSLFTLGDPASEELAALAEGGDTDPLTTLLLAMPEVKDVDSSGGLLEPGESVTVIVETRGKFNRISVASMLIPTNDGFFALNGIKGPKGKKIFMLFSPAYDAGSEPNDELCASIPGPVCGGEGGSPSTGGEGYVHIHTGIHGIGDIEASERDWRNPVAKITIRRVD
jgi:hypothetical protein